MTLEWIRRSYGVPAKRGGKVTVDGKPGVIVGASGQHLSVRFDGAKRSTPAHPTWRVTYLVTEPKRGRCGVCDRDMLLKADGTLRHHGGPIGSGIWSDYRSYSCKGVGTKPVEVPSTETGEA